MNYETAAIDRITRERLKLHDGEAVRVHFGGRVTRRAILLADVREWRDRVADTGAHLYGPLKRLREIRCVS